MYANYPDLLDNINFICFSLKTNKYNTLATSFHILKAPYFHKIIVNLNKNESHSKSAFRTIIRQFL